MASMTLMARGTFSSHVAHHMEYPADWYINFEQGDEVVTSVFQTPTKSSSEALCDALGIQMTNLRTHANIDVSDTIQKDLLKTNISDKECHSFYALRKADFKFFVLLEA